MITPLPGQGEPVSASASRQNLLLLSQLRWIAAGGQIATILFVHFVLGLPLPLLPMAMVIGLLLVLNVQTLWRFRREAPVPNAELFAQLLLDVAALTAQLYLSGGAGNPFVSLFLLQIILGAVLLEAWSAWVLVGVTVAAFLLLMRFAVPLAIPMAQGEGGSPLHVQGMFICFVLTAGLLVLFVNKINRNLRARDQRLADLRRQSAEEEHIVRMGLLASGAAHELGTPLATLSVILNDWRRMPIFQANPTLSEEIGDMRSQLDRCKAIVSGILLSSGEARGEGTVHTTVGAFLESLVAEWRSLRSPSRFDFRHAFAPDGPIVLDLALKQVIFSLFDNALEASPSWLGVSSRREGEVLVLAVEDEGLGFSPEVLQRFGKPYNSSKRRPGGGLGLFLVVNVARKLGGTVSAANRPQGGAIVTLALPLARLTVENGDGR